MHVNFKILDLTKIFENEAEARDFCFITSSGSNSQMDKSIWPHLVIVEFSVQSGFELGLLFLVMDDCNTSEQEDILNSVIPTTLWQRFTLVLFYCNTTVPQFTTMQGLEGHGLVWKTGLRRINPVKHLYDEQK